MQERMDFSFQLERKGRKRKVRSSSCVDCWSQYKEKKDFSFQLERKGRKRKGSKRKFESEIAPTGDPKEAVCFYCNTKGHWKRSCPKYLKDLKDGKVKKGGHSGSYKDGDGVNLFQHNQVHSHMLILKSQ
ncbi:retrotransposon protein, putative, ty1-copia subclass [Tanacetum coccineum]